MFRKIALFCALLGVFAFVAMPAYAEVQNIKVSGDIQAMGVYRNNYDLEDSETVHKFGSTRYAEDEDAFFMSVVRLRVDADLTDNVAATVRLANLRAWDDDVHAEYSNAYASSARITDDASIILDLAYITLKEMLYSPLTLVIGRQELNYGNGLIVGSGRYYNPNNSIEYRDLSTLHGYDAIRAILDYDPWVLDLVMAKMDETDDDYWFRIASAQNRDSDQNLYGVNLGYTFDKYEAEMEGYVFYKKDERYNMLIQVTGSPSNGRTFEASEIYTGGLRGSMVPMDNLTLMAEVAGQWGEISDQHAGPNGKPLTRDRQAMAANVAGEYNFADVRFNPTVGLEYLYLSGEEYACEGDFESWDPMYRGKEMGTIRDYLENLYTTNDPWDTSGWTNQHTVKVSGSMDLGELVDGLSMNLAYLHYWFDELGPNLDDEIGGEINLKVTYDYTEDVQFMLDSALFMPGDYYGKEVHNGRPTPVQGGGMARTDNAITSRVANDRAVSVVGSCKVTF